MAKTEKLKNGVKLVCDCGASHILTIDENNELILKSEFIKPKNKGVKKNDEPIKPKERRSAGSFFSIFNEPEEPEEPEETEE